ncbi:hydroxyproline-rich glycoprotein family protein [Trema orientale]|uniref:Hydroxyproline-rich glycoprotein family protein n=1 Tax=Trema orientale TaxID=63057 RepID=A0A2P5CMP3_TREOI|nr:hydroxyproline-rich glycoprotein family protein [Trema orientale]
MRGSSCIGRKLPYSVNLSNATRQTLVPFSTSSGDGRGRGRGGGSHRFDFAATPRAPGQPEPDVPRPDPNESPSSLGHGRGSGKPVASSPILPSFNSFLSPVNPPYAAGRGGPSNRVPGLPGTAEQRPPPEEEQESGPKKPIFFRREDGADAVQAAVRNDGVPETKEATLPDNIVSMLRGAGRGQPRRQRGPEIQTEEVNRHLRAPKAPVPVPDQRAAAPKMSTEEAVKHAMGILSRDSDGVDVGGGGRGRGGGRGGRGRGRRAWRDGGRGGRGRYQDADEGEETALYLGDDADGEKLAEKLGTETMSKLTEGFEEMGVRVLPSPLDDAYLDAMDYNYKLLCLDSLKSKNAMLNSELRTAITSVELMAFPVWVIEFEPEYMMGDFENNPDIDEKPPISLRDALEKAKPFLMAYEGIESQEEWEEIMKETMERVPLLKEIVDYYSGPDRVTAKKQHEELERVAKTLPAKAPDSVKQFTERAVLSLQNATGYGGMNITVSKDLF